MKYLGQEVIFLTPDGEVVENVVLKNTPEKIGDEIMFMELIDFSGNVKGGTLIDGKQTFKRLFMRRVYPYIKED